MSCTILLLMLASVMVSCRVETPLLNKHMVLDNIEMGVYRFDIDTNFNKYNPGAVRNPHQY